MPAERISKPRQEPVSCESCRRKKLKCDRSQPCHNCTSRGTACVFSGRATQNATSSTAAHSDGTFDDLRTENATIRARLRKLEDAVFDSEGRVKRPYMDTPSSVVTPPSGVDFTRAPQRPYSLASANLPAASQRASGYDADSQWLEGAGARVLTSRSGNADAQVHVMSLNQIIDQTCTKKESPAYVLLPFKDQLLELFRCYVEHLDALQHIIHVPSVGTTIDQLYDALQSRSTIDQNHLALVLCICASITAYWAQGEGRQLTFEACETGLPLATYWLRCSLDVLQYTWGNSTPVLETVQTAIIGIFLVYHTEGVSPRLRYLQSATLAAARTLGLHTVDSANNGILKPSQAENIEIEVRRRVWWHLASTEWYVHVIRFFHIMLNTIQGASH